MYKTRYTTSCLAFLAALVAMSTAWAADDPAAAKKENELKLIAVLTSKDSPKAEKAITCKKLAIYGSADAVPALKPLVAWG